MNEKQKEETWSHPARWWHTKQDGLVECGLCPRSCRIQPGQSGFCAVRRNIDGRLVTYSYGRPTGFGVDPIEKKPLYHFLPGSSILSFGTVGCNLGCSFCQNWHISRAEAEVARPPVEPEEVVRLAIREKCSSIAFTYNEPVIFGEFVIDVAGEARRAGLRNVMVTNGYVTPEARGEIFADVDGANVDLKSFRDGFYKEQTSARLAPVLDTLVWIRNETNILLEITTLLIPGLNDTEEEIREECIWIRENLGGRTPVHFTAFHPDFRLTGIPRTPVDSLQNARAIALGEGLDYVYIGNVFDSKEQSTICPGCGEVLIGRDQNSVVSNRLKEGACPSCGLTIPGLFS